MPRAHSSGASNPWTRLWAESLDDPDEAVKCHAAESVAAVDQLIAAHPSPRHGASPHLLEAAHSSFEGWHADLVETLTNERAHLLQGGDQLRVVLMGRTMAGKSTLFEALTGGDGRRIGVGAQRMTLIPEERPITGIPNAVLIDPPGVGALDGEEDVRVAFEAASTAHLVIWVAANDSTQEETAKALRMLAAAGRPIILVINCRKHIETPSQQRALLRKPERVFDAASAHADVVLRKLDESGQRALEVVQVHAQAAYLGMDPSRSELAEDLLRRSGISTLIERIEHETAEHANTRRLLRDADIVRGCCLHAEATSAMQVEGITRLIELTQRVTAELRVKASDAVNASADRTAIAVSALLEGPRQWVFGQDVSDEGKLKREWKQVRATLNGELQHLAEQQRDLLREELQDLFANLQSDWSVPGSFHAGQDMSLGSMTASWLHTATRVAGSIAATAGVGAAIGSVVPVAGTAVGAAVGALVGALASGLTDSLFTWLSGLFDSRETQLMKRRQKLAQYVGSELDKVQEGVLKSVEEKLLEPVRQHLADHLASVEKAARGSATLVQSIQDFSRAAAAARTAADLRSVRSLFTLTGLPESNAAVLRAQRSPGVGIACELADLSLHERLAAGAPSLGEAIVCTIGTDSLGAAVRIASLVAVPQAATSAEAGISILGRGDTPQGRGRAVELLASAFCGMPVTISIQPT